MHTLLALTLLSLTSLAHTASSEGTMPITSTKWTKIDSLYSFSKEGKEEVVCSFWQNEDEVTSFALFSPEQWKKICSMPEPQFHIENGTLAGAITAASERLKTLNKCYYMDDGARSGLINKLIDDITTYKKLYLEWAAEEDPTKKSKLWDTLDRRSYVRIYEDSRGKILTVRLEGTLPANPFLLQALRALNSR